MKWAQLYSNLSILWHCPFLGLEWKLTFSSPMAIADWVFQICWHIACSTLTASSFRILNSLVGIVLTFTTFVLNTHLTSHSRMSGSGWVTTPARLSEFNNLQTYWSCHLIDGRLLSLYIVFFPAYWKHNCFMWRTFLTC